MNDLQTASGRHSNSEPHAVNDPGTFATLLTEEGQHLLSSLRDYDPARELAVATRLRREHPAPLVSAALAQARLRQRAVAKFGPEDAGRMYFTPDGLEQATRAAVAAYRAARLAHGLGVRRLLDLCCGIGGDALALARAGVAVLAVDSDPLTCAVARANAEALGLAHLVEVRCADVTAAVAPVAADGPVSADDRPVSAADYDAVFVDPARRSTPGGAGARKGGGKGAGEGRIFDPEAYQPPLSWAVDVALKARSAALKVAPGLPHEAVPDDAEAEWISHRGEVKEAVLWFGGTELRSGAREDAALGPEVVALGSEDAALGPEVEEGAEKPPTQADRRFPPVSPGGVRATLLPERSSLAGRGLPDPESGPVRRYLYEPDGAVIRAHLVAEAAAEVDGELIDPTIAYITSDNLRTVPYATAYEITDVLPFHVKRLRALLREREVGVLTVKKRGSAVEPEELRKKMKLRGRNSATAFLTRVAGAPTVLLGHPAPHRP